MIRRPLPSRREARYCPLPLTGSPLSSLTGRQSACSALGTSSLRPGLTWPFALTLSQGPARELGTARRYLVAVSPLFCSLSGRPFVCRRGLHASLVLPGTFGLNTINASLMHVSGGVRIDTRRCLPTPPHSIDHPGGSLDGAREWWSRQGAVSTLSPLYRSPVSPPPLQNPRCLQSSETCMMVNLNPKP